MSVNSISELDQQEQKDDNTTKSYPETVSIEIFKNIKQLCINLSQIALSPEGIFSSLQLVNALKSLDNSLIDTAKNYSREKDGYTHTLIITTNLADYIFIPVASLLKRKDLKDAELEYILSIIHFLLKYCWGSPGYLKKELSVQFLPLLTYLIAGSPVKNDNKPIVEKSGKTVNNGILALKELFIGISNQGSNFKDDFFSDSRNLPPLGHLITVLLEISLNSKELDVQLNSLDTLKILYTTFNDSEFLSYIFPGNVSIISRIIKCRSTSKKIHYKVVVKCFEILTILTKTIFNDFELNTQLKNDKSEIENLNDLLLKAEKLTEDNDSRDDDDPESHISNANENLEVFIPEAQSNTQGIKPRDTRWLEETVKNLRKAFKSILKVDIERKEIKSSLLEFCYSVLKYNFQTLLSLIPDIVNAIGQTIDLNLLADDAIPEDDENNNTIINLVLLNVSEKHMKIFDLIVSRCFRSWLDDLSPSLLSPDAKMSIKLMNKLSFGILILNHNEDSNLDELIELLIKLLRNELVELVQSDNSNYIKTHSKVGTVNNKSLTSNSVESDILFIISNYSNNEIVEDKKNISLFHSLLIKEVENSLINFLKIISIVEHSSFICDQLIENVDGSSFNTSSFDNVGDSFELEKGSSSNSNNNEIQYFLILKSITIWLTSNILLAKKTKSQNVKDLVEIDDFLNFDEDEDEANADENKLEGLSSSNDLVVSYDSLYPILENSLEILESNSVREIDTPSYTKSSIIALNSISRASDIMGMDFKEELIDYLFPVIDLLASSNEMERITAQNTVINISKNCYNNSIHDLIFYNSDYLIDSLSVKLSSDLLTPRTPVILLVLIRIGGIEILNKLKEGILTTIFTLLDVYNHYSSLSESFFAIFNEIIESIYKNYFKKFDFKLLEFENDESYLLNNDYDEERDYNFLKPWGMKNINQVLELLEDKQKDIDGITESEDLQAVLKRHPNKPFEDAKDSDDEDSDDEDEDDDKMTELEELQKQLEARESESHPEDYMDGEDGEVSKQLVRQASPISKSMYLLLNQIFTYSDRLAMHDSIRLRLQILRLINRLIPILATSKDDLLPSLASTWPILKSYLDFSMNDGTGTSRNKNGQSFENLLHKEYSFGDKRSNIYNDFRIVELSCDCIETSFKFTGEFLSKNFLDLWEVLKTGFYYELFMMYQSKRKADSQDGKVTGNKLQKDTINSINDSGAIGGAAIGSGNISNQQVSSIDYKLNIYKKISKMLIFGLNKFGKLIPNEISFEMIKMTIIVYNDINDYKYFSDVAWYLSRY
ncbi:hypothetical protein BVG19_g4874 [[Candida] boidinii]|nr:hypothetical protein BVG19_g4874 [[Candida] boidinii]OWB53471.1 hypothetical protein B5S27_g5069 [[Candida] boidinii]